MNSLILQSIVDDIPFDSLPIAWQDHDFGAFSRSKTLYDFQQKALQNTIKALQEYYGHPEDFASIPGDKKEIKRKERFFRRYQNNGFSHSLNFDLKKKEGKQSAKFLIEYDKDYPAVDDKIDFKYFINRMSFWMATGSGKTLIIVKLLEILHKAIVSKEIPTNDILFLAHRDDLIEQFKRHVDEFNQFRSGVRINLHSLREYESIKRTSFLSFGNSEINVFYYRSDLLSDEHKEKLVNFRNYDNGGKWYILLDEAHKGDKEDSKRQIIYSILSRNGFLFNFSATFTDPRDFATCVFNFNLAKFIEEGYGKHIFLSEQDVSAFRNGDDFSPLEKQKIVLKTLILFAYVNKYSEKIKKIDKKLYHRPLLLTLVNSVNTEDADLLLFFQELEKIGKGKVSQKFFKDALNDIVASFKSHSKYLFEPGDFPFDEKMLAGLTFHDVLKHVFNSMSAGKIEALTIPSNKKELIFKLQTADKPFASIKIGDISGWLKDKLSGYEINESYDNESVFEKINHDDSDINILMGSRSFYEGWDSNRPNLLLYVNIGIGTDAKKFVLQSVGRGVRIEPVRHKRKRIQKLYNAGEVSEELFSSVNKYAPAPETLFIFGTNAANLGEVIASLKSEQIEQLIGTEFMINADVKDKLLLIPVYKDSPNVLADEKTIQKFSVTRDDLDLAKRYFNYLGDRVTLAKHDCEPRILEKVQDSFEKEESFYNLDYDQTFNKPDLIFDRIINHYSLRQKEFDRFKALQEEIVHFKRIKCTGDDQLAEFLEKIRQVKRYGEKAEKEKQLELQFDKDGDKTKYKKGIQQLERDFKPEADFKDLRIKYIQNHYYIPLILSDEEKIDYISHIITVPSEVKFIKDLEQYIGQADHFFAGFDWWLFSKLDENLDEIYIPYYNSKENRISKFKPDFIFWMKKGPEYRVIFIDPKGTEHVDAYHKIEGFKRLFEDSGADRTFKYNGYTVRVNLFLRPKEMARTLPAYRKYWLNEIDKIGENV
ncbi:MAG TPA: DEAD/DEAH box helicase family protein [Spirochaetota bacterium]|nr:DEAD/DEAH box helicase family protein [Spirochaetota bacterium]